MSRRLLSRSTFHPRSRASPWPQARAPGAVPGWGIVHAYRRRTHAAGTSRRVSTSVRPRRRRGGIVRPHALSQSTGSSRKPLPRGPAFPAIAARSAAARSASWDNPPTPGTATPTPRWGGKTWPGSGQARANHRCGHHSGCAGTERPRLTASASTARTRGVLRQHSLTEEGLVWGGQLDVDRRIDQRDR